MPIGACRSGFRTTFHANKESAGEFFELEKLAQACDKAGRYTFFFSSWPLNV